VVSRGRLALDLNQGLASLALGGLLVINTWDIAPFWLLYVGPACTPHLKRALAVALGSRGSDPVRWGWSFTHRTVGYGRPHGHRHRRRPHPRVTLRLFGWAIVLLAALGRSRAGASASGGVDDRRTWRRGGWPWSSGGGLGILVALLAALVPWPRGSMVRSAAAMVVGVGAFAAAMLLGIELVFPDDVFIRG
jgi:hypothetical protein